MNALTKARHDRKSLGCEDGAWTEWLGYRCGKPAKHVFVRSADGAMKHACGIHARVLRRSRGWKEVTS